MGKSKYDEQQENPYSNKPKNTAHSQQRLPAWQPLLTPRAVLPTLLVLGVALTPIGWLLMYQSQNLVEVTVDYTQCGELAPNEFALSTELRQTTFSPDSSMASTSATLFLGSLLGGQESPIEWRTARERNPTGIPPENDITVDRCTVRFNIPVDIQPPVFFYIQLTDFLQNHRSYVSSINAQQLQGEKPPLQEMSDCEPRLTDPDTGLIYYPCGLIANSYFNDTFGDFSRVESGSTQDEYTFSTRGISWESEQFRFGRTSYTHEEVVPPPTWQARYPNGRYEASGAYQIPDISQEERLINWMVVSALPSFRKLWGKNTEEIMFAGEYEVTVDDTFDVAGFGGRKAFIIANVSNLGGRNAFMGIFYMITGVFALVCFVIFLARQYLRPRKLGDHTYLEWNQEKRKSTSSGDTRRTSKLDSIPMSGISKKRTSER